MSEDSLFKVLIAEPDTEFGKNLEIRIRSFGNTDVARFEKQSHADDFIWGDIPHDRKSSIIPHEKSLIMISEYKFPDAASAGLDLAYQLRTAQKNAFIWMYSNEFEGTLSEGSVLYEVNQFLREKKINGYCRKNEQEIERMLNEVKRQISLYSSKTRARMGSTRQLPPIQKH